MISKHRWDEKTALHSHILRQTHATSPIWAAKPLLTHIPESPHALAQAVLKVFS